MSFLVALLALATSADPPLLFNSNAIVDVQLAGPMGTLMQKKRQRPELPFVLTANGIDHNLQIRVRGKSRLSVCSFPPLRLNFSQRDTSQTIFQDQDKLKLVTHCRSGSAAQVDTLQEYAAYRILNLITDISYRVRLLRITYADTNKRRKPSTHYAFALESETDLAQRTGAGAVKVAGVSLNSLNKDHLALVFIFQYLVGNTDWSLATASEEDVCCHNGNILNKGSQRYYVPYDFDLTGLVNAKYAYPDPKLRIRKVSQRLYRGFCLPSETTQNALDRIKSHHAEILNTLRTLPELSQNEIDASVRYLNQFFSRAENEKKLLSHFAPYCR